MNSNWLVVSSTAAALLLTGCGDKADARRQASPQTTLITVTRAEARPLEITEEVVGTLENFIDPKVSAEVAGRVTRVLAFTGKKVKKGDLLAEIDPLDLEIQTKSDAAELARLQTLLANQERVVANQQQLFEKNFISQNALDDAIAQRNALRAQVAAGRARAEGGQNALRKARIRSPVDGEVEVQIVAVGDYVKVGDPLFHLVGTQRLHAHLPFPESAGSRLKIGQTVRLSSPLVPGKTIEARIDEIRPTVSQASRAVDVIVKFDTDGGGFRGGGTVNANVVTGQRANAIMVPEQSVVLRPAGKVVYVVNGGKATQRLVETGARKDGRIEIVAGLSGGETIAVEGAGFLTDNANVALAQPRGPAGSPAAPTAAEPAPKGAKGGA